MSELKERLLKFYNEAQRKGHEEFLNDTETLARYRQYSWWTPESEEYPSPLTLDDFSWAEIVGEIPEMELDGYKFKSLELVGGEGEGDHMHWVFSITDPEGNTVYWLLNGYWVSHDGAYWDEYEPYQVVPKQRMVTFYEAL